VAPGQAIDALDRFHDQLARPQPVTAFVKRQLQNPRPAVRRNAARFLARYRRIA
jgi:hypothetical protein